MLVCLFSRIYTGGCYYFNKTTEEWEGVGLSVEEGFTTTNINFHKKHQHHYQLRAFCPGGSNILSSCSSDHLTSFGTGYFPAPNTIDFEYMMVEFDVADNVTIFMVLVVTTLLFLIALIWAKCKDSRDIQEQKPHWMKDNLVEDHYFYEVTIFNRIPLIPRHYVIFGFLR